MTAVARKLNSIRESAASGVERSRSFWRQRHKPSRVGGLEGPAPRPNSLDRLLRLEWLAGQLAQVYEPGDARVWRSSPSRPSWREARRPHCERQDGRGPRDHRSLAVGRVHLTREGRMIPHRPFDPTLLDAIERSLVEWSGIAYRQVFAGTRYAGTFGALDGHPGVSQAVSSVGGVVLAVRTSHPKWSIVTFPKSRRSVGVASVHSA